MKKHLYSIYSFFEENNLFSPYQSGFRKKDSCVSQLLVITHEIFANFNVSPTLETRAVFLDISKAFDWVWHEGLLFELQSYGIQDTLLNLIKSFLSNRFQRVILNDHCSTWEDVLAGVPKAPF